MQFVKSSLYQAEITEGGVREREVDTRTKEQVELEERLRKLPEFSRNPNFKSYAEQMLEGVPQTSPEAPASTEQKVNPNLPASVTEEEFEFYEALRAQHRRKRLARQKEEEEMRSAFLREKEKYFDQQAECAAEKCAESRPAPSPSCFLEAAVKGGKKGCNGVARGEDGSPFEARRSDTPQCGSIFDLTSNKSPAQPASKKRFLPVRGGGLYRQPVQKAPLEGWSWRVVRAQLKSALGITIKKPKTDGEEVEDNHRGSPSSPSNEVPSKEGVCEEDSSRREDSGKSEAGASGKEAAAAPLRHAPSGGESNAFASLCEDYGDSGEED